MICIYNIFKMEMFIRLFDDKTYKLKSQSQLSISLNENIDNKILKFTMHRRRIKLFRNV